MLVLVNQFVLLLLIYQEAILVTIGLVDLYTIFCHHLTFVDTAMYPVQ